MMGQSVPKHWHKNSGAGELPRRKHTKFRTWWKFEIKKNYTFSVTSIQLGNSWENNASVKEALKSQKHLHAAH